MEVGGSYRKLQTDLLDGTLIQLHIDSGFELDRS